MTDRRDCHLSAAFTLKNTELKVWNDELKSVSSVNKHGKIWNFRRIIAVSAKCKRSLTIFEKLCDQYIKTLDSWSCIKFTRAQSSHPGNTKIYLFKKLVHPEEAWTHIWSMRSCHSVIPEKYTGVQKLRTKRFFECKFEQQC